MNNNDFYTFSEYMKKNENTLTASMQDYLEMIYRLSMDSGFTRIHELSEALNIQPPSATRMVQRLAELNFIKYEKYGVIMLQENGKKAGEALLKRHNNIEIFLKAIGVSEPSILEETEKIEHTISEQTVKAFGYFVSFMRENPEFEQAFSDFRELKKEL
jgi:Mn-dependent DtxR family transcriptional regulator